MKKKLIILLAAILVFVSSSVLIIALTGRKKANVIRVNEVTHSIFYAPFYVAIEQGFFKEEGIIIELTDGGGSNNSMTAIISGSAEVALLGPETAVYTALSDISDQPKLFAQLTKRDGAILLGRTDTTNFQWTDLIGKTVIGGREGGMPAMTLQYIIEQIYNLEIGTGAGQVNLRDDVQFNAIFAEYERSGAEYCTLFEPNASLAIAEGKAYRLSSVGADSGEIPYTGFAAKESYMQKNPEKIKSFTRALVKAYNFMIEEDVDTVVEALARQFKTTPKADIKAALEVYIAIDAWADSPVMKESAFDRMQDVMMNAGVINAKVAFNKFVDNTYALSVMEEFAS